MRESVVFRSPIVITLPYMIYGEAIALRSLVNAGADIIHIRKPEATAYEIDTLLAELQSLCGDISNFTLHYDLAQVKKYSMGGAHLSREELERIHAGNDVGNDADTPDIRRSCSVHSWEEAKSIAHAVDYMFISPLFDSVSKQGYKGTMDARIIKPNLEEIPYASVVALSGIDCNNIWEASRLGFDGVAVLGSVWSVKDNDLYGNMEKAVELSQTIENYSALLNRWRAAKCGILQLISDGDIDTAIGFLQGGGKWIQLRMKDCEEEKIIERGREIFTLCQEAGAVFIINDNPCIAKELGAHGVHLGKNDITPAEARQIIGEEKIIGATANTFDDIEALKDQPIDYIGLGPYRFTTTKKNLSPTLGIEGYRDIFCRMKKAGINIPVVAIGGIEPEDSRALIESGAWGIAVAGAISVVEDKTQKTLDFIKYIL